MRAFTTHTGKVLPLDRANVDTDAIIPKQYLKSIRRTGFGPFLFDDWRYLDKGDLSVDPKTRRVNQGFVLNDPRFAQATVLLARDNFGCGSSREHAVWALADYGFRAVIAPSFADIFHTNCFKNGVLPVALPASVVDELFQLAQEGFELTVDLAGQSVSWIGGAAGFDVDAFRKDCLLKGLDEIGLTLQHADAIREYEARRRAEAPWLLA